MQLLTAKISKAPRQVTTKYGDRTVADVVLPDGTETALWRPANDAALIGLHTGQPVTVAKDSKGKISLIDNAATVTGANPETTAAAPTQSLKTEGMTPETKKAIAAYVTEMGDLYRYCYETAGEKLATAPNEAKQAMASSLFIAAQRKFNLT